MVLGVQSPRVVVKLLGTPHRDYVSVALALASRVVDGATEAINVSGPCLVSLVVKLFVRYPSGALV